MNINNKFTAGQITSIVLLILLLVFIAQNVSNAQVRFLFFRFELPIIVLMGATFLIGYLTARLFPPKTRNEKQEKPKDESRP